MFVSSQLYRNGRENTCGNIRKFSISNLPEEPMRAFTYLCAGGSSKNTYLPPKSPSVCPLMSPDVTICYAHSRAGTYYDNRSTACRSQHLHNGNIAFLPII